MERHSRFSQTIRAARHNRRGRSLSLLQKILICNLAMVLGGLLAGSWLAAQLAEIGGLNPVTFSVIIFCAVLLSGSISFSILKRAFRPFEELQSVVTKIHSGNPRARASLKHITDPDVRQFTAALNQMLTRLEENAKVIQQDQHQLQLMTARVMTAQENERKRIARELHDEASQSLTAIMMGLEAAKSATADTVQQQRLNGLKDMAASTLDELRKLALDLRPTMLDDLGLVPAVRWLSRTSAERGNFETHLDLAEFNENERLSSEVETALFRIAQESLTNIVRHAHASRVLIKLAYQDDETVNLIISDNGRGFDRAAAKAAAYNGGHLGLFDIEERATLLGGKLTIETSPVGTRLSVTLPTVPRPAPMPSPHINTHAAPYTQPYHFNE